VRALDPRGAAASLTVPIHVVGTLCSTFGGVVTNDVQRSCLQVALEQFTGQIAADHVTVLADDPAVDGPNVCQIDLFDYDSSALLRTRVDVPSHLALGTQVAQGGPDLGAGEVQTARTLAEVGPLASALSVHPDVIVAPLAGAGDLPTAGGSQICRTHRCAEIRYYARGTVHVGDAAEPLGTTFTFTDDVPLGSTVVDLTDSVVVHTEVF
jgi:hypothetical protein